VLLEPIPLSKTKRPPVIPAASIRNRKDAVFYMADVYSAPA